MSLGDHINIHLKQGVEIITCDPGQGLIEAKTRNGEVISINAYHRTPTFRWPIPGEKWMVTEENGSWFLDGIYEQQQPFEPKPGEMTPVKPGDTIITAGSGTIWKNVEGKLEPLVEEVEEQLRVLDYVENAAAKEYVLARNPEGIKSNFEVPVSKKARFILVIFGIDGTRNFGEVVLEGKHIALTERSGSVGALYRTTLTIVIPPTQKCVITGTATGEIGEGGAAEVQLVHLWESVS